MDLSTRLPGNNINPTMHTLYLFSRPSAEVHMNVVPRSTMNTNGETEN